MHAQLRASAEQDIAEAVDDYREGGRTELANDFVDALEATIADLCNHPLVGTLRFAFELEIPDLRSWPLQRFPYLVVYMPDDDRIDIWRVLHARRDIPAFLIADSPD